MFSSRTSCSWFRCLLRKDAPIRVETHSAKNESTKTSSGYLPIIHAVHGDPPGGPARATRHGQQGKGDKKLVKSAQQNELPSSSRRCGAMRRGGGHTSLRSQPPRRFGPPLLEKEGSHAEPRHFVTSSKFHVVCLHLVPVDALVDRRPEQRSQTRESREEFLGQLRKGILEQEQRQCREHRG